MEKLAKNLGKIWTELRMLKDEKWSGMCIEYSPKSIWCIPAPSNTCRHLFIFIMCKYAKAHKKVILVNVEQLCFRHFLVPYKVANTNKPSKWIVERTVSAPARFQPLPQCLGSSFFVLNALLRRCTKHVPHIRNEISAKDVHWNNYGCVIRII